MILLTLGLMQLSGLLILVQLLSRLFLPNSGIIIMFWSDLLLFDQFLLSSRGLLHRETLDTVSDGIRLGIFLLAEGLLLFPELLLPDSVVSGNPVQIDS